MTDIKPETTEESSASTSPYYTVAITGASGMFGNAIINELTKNHKTWNDTGKPLRIIKLVRADDIDDDDQALNTINQETAAGGILSLKWNPNANASDNSSKEAINNTALRSIDALLHLAGENVGESLLPFPLDKLGVRAWSQTKKDLIMDSRVGPTKALAEAIRECDTPTTFVVASGVGVYGNDFMQNENKDALDEDSPDESYDTSNTTGFLADVSREWEAASIPAIATDGNSPSANRLVNLRLAPILSKKGGALGKLYPIFFLGGGGIVGHGKQYFPYISARDAARAVVHILGSPNSDTNHLEGPINIVAPTPATNTEFTRALGKVLSRPTIVPLPAFLVKILFGEMGEEMLLGGVRAHPKKLLESGFVFQHETVEDALEDAVREEDI